MAAPLEFWFEFASTYSYIAAMQIETSCREAGIALKWRPFMLGPIFALQGWNDSHFNLNPRRGAYMWRDMERLTEKLALPFRRPSEFPRPTTLAARVACALAGEPAMGDYVRAVYVANFGYDRNIGDGRVIEDILTELGYQADEVVARATSPDGRLKLRENTERAIELGIFGSPNGVVGTELFWGEEAIGDAIDWAKKTAIPSG